MSEDAPIFIVGSERSGTTLLMALLGHHPRLAVPEVTWYYPRFRAHIRTYGDLADPANFRTLAAEMALGLKTPFFGLPWNPRTIVDEVVERAPRRDFAGAFAAILGRYAEDVGKPRWGEKTPHNLFYVREILADFPGARFLNLVRDGRDVAVEQLRSAFGPRNVYAAAQIWRNVQREADRQRAALPPERWLDVPYELLAREPETVLQGVFAFIGEAWDPAVLAFHRGETAQRRARTRDHRQLGEPVNAAHVGIHRRHLSLHEQAVFAGVAGRELRAAGYALDVDPVELDPAEAALLAEHDQRIRAATLDAPEGHIVYESYNDWLADQREERRRRGVWQDDRPANLPDWPAEFLGGQRAPRYWKQRFAIPRRYEGDRIVL